MLAAAAYGLIVAVAWLPFYLAAPSSLSSAGKFQIAVSHASVLHLFGVDGGTPAWCRPAQLALGLIAVTIAVARHRWEAALLAGVCARLLLDPGTKNYYDTGLVVASAVYDLVAVAGLIPWMTVAALIMVYVPSYALSHLPTERAVLRLAFFVLAPVVALAAVRPPAGRWPGPARAFDDRSCVFGCRECV